MTEITSNWSHFNIVGQIDGHNDKNCTIASNLSQKLKKIRDITICTMDTLRQQKTKKFR